MSDKPPHADYFIGWRGITNARTGFFLACIALLIVTVLGVAGFGLSRTLDDPSASLLRLGERDAQGATLRPADGGPPVVLRGYLSATGYPLLHVLGDSNHPRDRVLLLSGEGKRAADVPASPGPVEISGNIVRRGSLEMLVADAPAKPLPASPEWQAPARELLGRWRISGEICDGKCYTGAMRPGAGLAHRACANLCLIGDIPPVFVTMAPVAGSSFLILESSDQGKLPEALRAVTGIPVELEGIVERIGNALIFRVDPGRAKRL